MQNFQKQKGFTLVEMIIYVSFFALLSVLAMQAIMIVMKSFYTLRITQSVNQSATVSVERMSREIRNAYDIDATQSIFGVHPGRLTLKTKNEVGANATIEFYVDGTNQIHLKEDGIEKGSLLTKNTTVTNFVVRYLSNTNSKAIKIEVSFTDSRYSIAQTIKFYDTIVLRGSMR